MAIPEMLEGRCWMMGGEICARQRMEGDGASTPYMALPGLESVRQGWVAGTDFARSAAERVFGS